MKISITFLALMLSLNLFGQTDFPYRISLEPLTINGVSGVHSYTLGQYEGKWIVIGGRLDGMHTRQPFNAFPNAQNNTSIFVIDPIENTVQSATVNDLPVGLKEQMQSTNMQFFQDDNHLVIIGGYGYSPSEGDHRTYPNLTVVDLPELVDAIENETTISTAFQQITDDYFAVTGGYLGKIDDEYYLVGGHRFDGRYNPMNMPTFVQTYTDAIRKFTLADIDDEVSFVATETISDVLHLHRRDYNLAPQIFPDGTFGYTIFSGVFQINQEFPFLYPVNIKDDGHEAIENFNQYLNHYHCAQVALFDNESNQMHNIFFGGMSQYYYANGNLIQDDDVPFVKTISRVSRDSEGTLTEAKLPIEMPDLMGASAEFIINQNLEQSADDIVEISNIQGDSVLLGYIFGGIHSNGLNPFFQNNTGITSASTQAFKVWIARDEMVSIAESPIKGYHDFEVEVSPNPVDDTSFQVKIKTPESGKIKVLLSDMEGNMLMNQVMEGVQTGENTMKIEVEPHVKGMLFLTVELNGRYCKTEKVIVK